MGSVTLSNPQTLNLYAYCTNDPVNYVDPSGLGFFSFLKKLFKWVMVAIAVIVAVITIVGVVTTPFTIAGLLGAVSAGAGAAASVLGALGYQKAARIFGIIAMVTGIGSLIAAKAGISLTWTALAYEKLSWKAGEVAFKAFEAARSAAMHGLLTGVGSLVNSYQSKSKKKEKSPVQDIVDNTIGLTLARLTGDCLTYIGSGAKKILETLQSRKHVVHNQSVVGGGVARATEGMRHDGTIYLGDEFFRDNPGGWKRHSSLGSAASKINTASRVRQMVLLHELRHVVTGITHDGGTGNSNADFNKTIAEKCF